MNKFKIIIAGILLASCLGCEKSIHGVWEFDSVKDEKQMQREIDSTMVFMRKDTSANKQNMIDLNKPALIRNSYHKKHLSFYGIASIINRGKGVLKDKGDGYFIIKGDTLNLFDGPSDMVWRSWVDYNSQTFYDMAIYLSARYKKQGKDTLLLISQSGHDLVFTRRFEKKDPNINNWDYFWYKFNREFEIPKLDTGSD